jgi:ParB family chromosome partitioning protein
MKTTVQSIPLDKLEASPANVRRDRQVAALEELAASIEAHGLLQMPVVRPKLNSEGEPTGRYLVDVGESRRQALRLLAKRKVIKRNEPIACAVRTDGEGVEISLAENVVRMPMHPADQFAAFARLHRDQGLGPEEIAARFGITTTVVRQRLKLAAVGDGLMQRYRDGELTLEQLMAFAITDDHDLQEQVWSALGWDKSPAAIRRRLMAGHVDARDRRVRLIGLAAYEAAGGTVLRDLFSTEDDGWVVDSTLLDHLVMERLEKAAESVRGEGWQWVEVMIDYPYARVQDMRRVHPEQVPLPEEAQARHDALCARLDELAAASGDDEASDEEARELAAIDAELDALLARQRVFRAEDLARAGALVSLDVDGGIRVDRGLLQPMAVEAATGDPSGDGEDGHGAGEAKPGEPSVVAEEGHGRRPLPEKLVTELTTGRTLALQACLASRPDMAMLAVTHALAVRILYGAAHDSCLVLKPETALPQAALDAVGESRASRAMADERERWAACLPQTAADLWPWLLGQDEEVRHGLMAYCAARTIDAVSRPWEQGSRRLAHADRLADALGLDMTAWWAPTRDTYLGRVAKAQILEAVREAVSPQAAENIAGMKKEPMALRAQELLADTGWLPEILRSTTAREAPQPSAAEAAE